MDADPTFGIPISDIKRDKDKILENYARKEPSREQHRQLMKSKERVDVVKKINNLIDKWYIEPNEIFECGMSDENWIIPIDEPFGPDYSQEALDYSIVIHDIFGIDYKCKECVVRPICCRFSNFQKFEDNGECDGISQLLNATIIKDIEDYYLDERKNND